MFNSVSLESSIARQILVILHHQVLPNMTKGRAVRTADWLGEWVDRGASGSFTARRVHKPLTERECTSCPGGPLGLLALNSLFILITQYNLCVLILSRGLKGVLRSNADASVSATAIIRTSTRSFTRWSTARYCTSNIARASFVLPKLSCRRRASKTSCTWTLGYADRLMPWPSFRLRHLPATLIASFAKRLARLALFAPPAGVVIVIPFIYNLLKMHPSCMVLIHRDTYGGEELSLSGPIGAAGASPPPGSMGDSLTSEDADEAFTLPRRPLRTVQPVAARVQGARFVALGGCRPPAALSLAHLVARKDL